MQKIESTLSERARVLIEHFDTNNMQNCAILAEVLERHSEIAAIACVRYLFTPEGRKSFSSDAHYWLAQGLFSQSVVLGFPGHQTPLESLEQVVHKKPFENDVDFWKSVEADVAPRMNNHVVKGFVTDPNTGIIVILNK